MAKYGSGSKKVTPNVGLRTNRYQYLALEDAEPNLGFTTEKILPIKDNYYQLVSFDGGTVYDRYWQVAPAGIITGISVFDEGGIVGTGNSINKLDFRGNIITATANNFGTISTITVAPPGNDTQLIYNSGGNFAASANLTFSSNVLSVTGLGSFSQGSYNQYIRVGVASNNIIDTTSGNLVLDANSGITSIKSVLLAGITTFSGSNSSNLVTLTQNGSGNALLASGTVISGLGSIGVGTTVPTQELDVNGDVRLRGTIYDYNNVPGSIGQILVKNSLGGLEWVNQSTLQTGAGGTYTNIQYQTYAGIMGGASNFVYESITSRVGIGSTLPQYLLDVLGYSRFTGQTEINNLRVTGVATVATLGVTGLATAQNLIITGVSTAATLGVTGLATAQNLIITGVSTVATLGVTGLTTTKDLRVTGIATVATLGVTGLTTSQNLIVTGLSTLTGARINNVYVGTTDNNTISTPSGNLILDSSGGTTQVKDILFVDDTTATTSTTDGALVVKGGVGIGGSVNIGGSVAIAGTSRFISNVTIDTSASLLVSSTTQSTNKDTGSVIIEGGVGIEKNLNVGGASSITGIATFGDKILPYNSGTQDIGSLSQKWNNLYVNTVNGNIIGYASSIAVSLDSTNVNRYIPFVDTTTGLTTVRTDDSLIWNPSSNSLVINATSLTGTASLQVTGNTYVSGLIGVGIANPTSKLHIVGDGYFTGVVTATTFNGNLNGYAVNAGVATYAVNAGVATYAVNAGVATYAVNAGVATYAVNAGTSTSVIGGIGSIGQLQVTGVSTFVNGPVLIGGGNSTGTLGQVLQVTGINSSAYIGGNLGIGTTNPSYKLDVIGSGHYSGNLTVDGTINASINGNASSATKLQTARTISATSDISWSVSFDGSTNATAAATLPNTGVSAATYGSSTQVPVFAVDAKGRVTSVTNTGINFSTATVQNADNIKTVSTATNASFYPTFVDTNNGTAAYEALYTDSGISYNPNTDLLSITSLTASGIATFNGNVTLGDAITDTVSFTSRIDTSVLPSTNASSNTDVNGKDLGGTSNYWRKIYTKEILGSVTGNADTATALLNSRNFSIGGDVTAPSISFNGTGDVSLSSTLQSTGVVAATYGSSTTIPQIAVDAKGRITSASSVGVNFSAATVSQSDKVATIATATNTSFYPTFVDSNNVSSGYELLYTDAGISYNPSTDLLTVTGLTASGTVTFNGNVTFGDATTDTVSFTSRVNTAIIPSTDGTLNLGGTSNKWNNVYANSFVGAVTGNTDTATKLQTARTISATSDISWSVSFDGSTNATAAATLAASGVAAATYGSSTQIPVFAVDAKGRVTSVTNTGINFSTATVSQSDAIKTVSTSTNATFYPTFVDSNNASAAYESVYTDAGISYNPSTDLLTVTAIKPGQIQDSGGGTGTANYVLTANGTGGGWTWKSVTGTGAIGGISVQQGGTPVGTVGGITTLNFSGATVTASTSTATITVSAGGVSAVNQTGYGCANPITVSGTAINISSASNAYGTRYIQTTAPASACDGDIWYDTSTGTGTDSGAFPSGTTLLFYQAAAPTGWTQVTTHNDKALRVVSGAGGGSGGTSAFTSVFASRTPYGTVAMANGAFTLTINELASHTHAKGFQGGDSNGIRGGNSSAVCQQVETGSAGGGASHTHPNTAAFAGTAMDFAVQYINVILCSKN